MESKSEKKFSINKTLTKGLKYITIGHLALATMFSGARGYERLQPNPEQEHLLKNHNVELITNRYLSEQNISMRNILDVLEHERTEELGKKITLHYYPTSFIQQPYFSQLEQIITTRWSGRANRLTNTISMKTTNISTLIHEIAHFKGYEALKNPEFKERWISISGNQHYKSSLIFAETKYTAEELEKHGFVSNYARTNIREDIAETAESVISSTLYDKIPQPSEKIFEKIKLLAEYNIIDKDIIPIIEFEQGKNLENQGYMECAYRLEDVIREEERLKQFVEQQQDNRYLTSIFEKMASNYMYAYPTSFSDDRDSLKQFSEEKMMEYYNKAYETVQTHKQARTLYLNLLFTRVDWKKQDRIEEVKKEKPLYESLEDKTFEEIQSYNQEFIKQYTRIIKE